jgi:hypothetical protein
MPAGLVRERKISSRVVPRLAAWKCFHARIAGRLQCSNFFAGNIYMGGAELNQIRFPLC